MSPLDRALDHFKTKAAMARAIGAKPMTVQHWFRDRQIPIEHAVKLEKVTGGLVTAAELRPDVFGHPTTNEAA